MSPIYWTPEHSQHDLTPARHVIPNPDPDTVTEVRRALEGFALTLGLLILAWAAAVAVMVW